MNKEIHKILDSYQNEMIDNLQKLIRIKSLLSESKTDAPFGDGIQESLEFVLELGREKGFECTNFNNFACELNLGDSSASVGVVSHLDVVPEGCGWTFDPFGGQICDGKIYGRGAVDDKGPLIAAFYACCAIKDSGVHLSKKIKHIIGTNEESGKFTCIEYYKELAQVPECGIVPDSWFPVAYAEKGFYNFQFNKNFNASGIQVDEFNKLGIRLVDIQGGEALNIVAPDASANFIINDKGYEAILKAVENFNFQEKVVIEKVGNNLVVKTIGKAAHASTPEIGINAISILLCFLEGLEFLPAELSQTINQLAKMVGKDTDGVGLGINYCDHTGSLTNNLGMILYTDEVLNLKMNIRCPITMTSEVLESKLIVASKIPRMDYELLHYNPHFYMPKNDPLIELLSGVYQEVTGDFKSKPKAHGGGSYARILKNFVPFGPSIEEEELCFHKQDEYISCERLLLLSKIYAEALYQLAK